MASFVTRAVSRKPARRVATPQTLLIERWDDASTCDQRGRLAKGVAAPSMATIVDYLAQLKPAP
jgi:hypothetical protein